MAEPKIKQPKSSRAYQFGMPENAAEWQYDVATSQDIMSGLDAIGLFADQKRTEDGGLDGDTQVALHSEMFTAYGADGQPQDKSIPVAPSSKLRLSDQSAIEKIKLWQAKLAELGLYRKDLIDGKVGPLTKAAWAEAQRKLKSGELQPDQLLAQKRPNEKELPADPKEGPPKRELITPAQPGEGDKDMVKVKGLNEKKTAPADDDADTAQEKLTAEKEAITKQQAAIAAREERALAEAAKVEAIKTFAEDKFESAFGETAGGTGEVKTKVDTLMGNKKDPKTGLPLIVGTQYTMSRGDTKAQITVANVDALGETGVRRVKPGVNYDIEFNNNGKIVKASVFYPFEKGDDHKVKMVDGKPSLGAGSAIVQGQYDQKTMAALKSKANEIVLEMNSEGGDNELTGAAVKKSDDPAVKDGIKFVSNVKPNSGKLKAQSYST